MDENALSFDCDAVPIGEVADGERLDPFGALDMSPRAQRPSEWCPTPVTQGEGARIGGSARPVGRRAQHMIEHEGAHTAMDVLRRAFIGSAENEFGPHQSVPGRDV